MARAGRKPKAEADRRSERVSVYLTRNEIAELEARAEQAGVSLPVLLRQAGLDTEGGVRRAPAVNRDLARRLSSALSNLNQLGRWANRGHRVDADLRPILDELYGLVTELREALRG